MHNSVIIGSGFSAWISSLLLNNPITLGIATELNKHQFLPRRKEFEINKILSRKSYSFGYISSSNLLKFHDRLIDGGNSNIWGGFCNVEKLPSLYYEFLSKYNIRLQPLSLMHTGSISNNKYICQFQSLDNSILNVSKFINKNIINSFVTSINLNNRSNTIVYNLIINNKIEEKKFTLSTEKIVLAIGLIQLLNLLKNSFLISDNDIFEISEFNYVSSIFSTNYPNYFLDTNSCIIRYEFLRGLYHYIGYQKLNQIKFLSKIYIDQQFQITKNTLKFKFIGNKLVKIKSNLSSDSNFGSSIHYCNLKINGISVNSFLENISKNLIGIGMPFVDQTYPGPISNDIMIDAYNKLVHEQ